VPLLIMLVMFGWGARVYFEGYRVPEDAQTYYVVGKRWMWKFQHPDGQREINDFHVPVGRKIELVITSEDVIHSFFVPDFRVKRDAVPGRYTRAWFEATKTGEFRIFCAEYCGAEHSLMRGKLVVMEPHEYDRWLSGNRPGTPLAASGEALFAAKSCNTCHRPDSATRAPILHGLFGNSVTLASGRRVEVDEGYLRASIMDPAQDVVAGYEPIMPTYRGQLSEEEILELIAYVQSLQPPTGSEGGL
jgi:cytochrome c oxidase subunit 2